VTRGDPSHAPATTRRGPRDYRAMTADERERRLRSLLLALAPYLVADTPFALEQALWREAADEMLPEHAVVSGPDPWRIVTPQGVTGSLRAPANRRRAARERHPSANHTRLCRSYSLPARRSSEQQ
jgi:hypothetical protein